VSRSALGDSLACEGLELIDAATLEGDAATMTEGNQLVQGVPLPSWM